MTTRSFSWDTIKSDPATKTGRWAIGLAGASIVLILAYSVLPGGAWAGFICGIIAGVMALFAISRRQERSYLVFLAILPLVWVLLFLAAELLIPH